MARKPGVTPPAPLANGHDPEVDTSLEPDVQVDETGTGDSQRSAAAEPEEDESVAELRRQLAEATQRAERSESEANRLRGENRRDQEVLQDSRLLVIESTITAKETEKAAILREIIEAKESGDYAAETSAVDKLQNINIDLKQARLGKDRIEGEIENQKNAPAEPQTEDDRIEAWFVANKVAPASQNWLRNHKEYLTDSVKNAELGLAHQRAVRAGLTINSPEYFNAVEENLGLREANLERDTTRQNAQDDAPAPAAPVSRSAGVGGGGQATSHPGIFKTGANSYRVTAEVREAAAISGIPLKDYIESALKLTRGADGQLH